MTTVAVVATTTNDKLDVIAELLTIISSSYSALKKLNIQTNNISIYGVEEQNILIKRSLLVQLWNIRRFIDCQDLINEIQADLDKSVDNYIYSHDVDQQETERILNLIWIKSS